MNSDLKLIKKHYGEDMMHYARENFPIILEEEGVLSKFFLDNFAESKTLYEDLKENDELVKFKNFIYILYNVKDEDNNVNYGIKSPEELMNDAGYNLYECKTEDDIQSFKKYYSKGEELCTFIGRRLNTNRVFFAVKKDVDKIRRENFKNPEREDEYGTSVISIQFTNDGTNTLSIKNRYNHTVSNPDATFKNNLDNIIKGLTKSFEVHYGIKQKYINIEEFKEFVRASDGKYYKYNYERFGIHYCNNNVIIQYGIPKKLEKEKYIIMDNFVLNLQNKSFEKLDYGYDCFPDTIKNIKSIEVRKNGNNKNIIIKTDKKDIIVEVNKKGEIISYINNNITEINSNFLECNKTLQYLELNNVVSIGNNFLLNNNVLKSLSINNVKTIGNNFIGFSNNTFINQIDFSKLETIGNGFMSFCGQGITKISLPNIQSIGNDFLKYLKSNIEILDFPKLDTIGEYFMYYANGVKIINLPNIKCLSSFFLSRNNEYVSKLNLQNCQIIEGNVMIFSNVNLNNANFSNLENIGNSFLHMSNTDSDIINIPKVVNIGDDVLSFEKNVKFVNSPMLKRIGKQFLQYADNLQIIILDKLEYIDEDSLRDFLAKHIRKYKSLNEQDKIVKLKQYFGMRIQINKLLNLKNVIIQNLYTKTKVLKK